MLKTKIKLLFWAHWRLVSICLLLAAGSASADPCWLAHGGIFSGYPIVGEAKVGITAGTADVNPHRSCAGMMVDLGIAPRSWSTALGYRSSQRYDWPVTAHLALVRYQPRSSNDDGAFYPNNCQGLEGAFGVLGLTTKVGLLSCRPDNRLLPLIQAGFFF